MSSDLPIPSAQELRVASERVNARLSEGRRIIGVLDGEKTGTMDPADLLDHVREAIAPRLVPGAGTYAALSPVDRWYVNQVARAAIQAVHGWLDDAWSIG